MKATTLKVFTEAAVPEEVDSVNTHEATATQEKVVQVKTQKSVYYGTYAASYLFGKYVISPWLNNQIDQLNGYNKPLDLVNRYQEELSKISSTLLVKTAFHASYFCTGFVNTKYKFATAYSASLVVNAFLNNLSTPYKFLSSGANVFKDVVQDYITIGSLAYTGILNNFYSSALTGLAVGSSSSLYAYADKQSNSKLSKIYTAIDAQVSEITGKKIVSIKSEVIDNLNYYALKLTGDAYEFLDHNIMLGGHNITELTTKDFVDGTAYQVGKYVNDCVHSTAKLVNDGVHYWVGSTLDYVHELVGNKLETWVAQE